MEFDKYHTLGNDYIVVQPDPPFHKGLPADKIRAICEPHFGIGSDGILLGPLFPSDRADWRVRIYNPDGSEAEKSGNGLRIFARHLKDKGLVEDHKPFTIDTIGGVVEATTFNGGRTVKVDMGIVSFVALDQQITAGERTFTYHAADIGNPHCVIFLDEVTPELAKKYGPLIENNPLFHPNRTNVQFVKVLDRGNIQMEIWERGAEYTLASGSSSSAAGAVAVRLGLCDQDIVSHMPGGNLYLFINNDYGVQQTGPVARTMEHQKMSDEIFDRK